MIAKTSSTLPARVRELRSRFVCNELKFNGEHFFFIIIFYTLFYTMQQLAHHLRKTDTKNCHKRVSLKDRHSLTVFSHKMRNELDTYNPNDSDDDGYSPR